MTKILQSATFGAGCFWCTEAIFQQIKGVVSVTSGYSGGLKPNPTYQDVCSHATGHAEVVQVEFDPQIVSFESLVEIFFLTHDPTQLNRQGNDIGQQYRSVIFYHDQAQRQVAVAVMARLKAEQVFNQPIVTEIQPLTAFYPAESYHQDYFRKNPDQPYCQTVINPKLAKFRQRFASLLAP